MPSPAERRRLEHGLRVAALAALAALGARALWSGPARARESATVASLDSALVAWTRRAPAGVQVRAARVPSRAQRDWLLALRRAGTAVGWELADSLAPSALVVEPLPSPRAPARVTVAAASHDTVPISDAAGLVDAPVTGALGVFTWRGSVAGLVEAAPAGARPASARRDSVLLRSVLVRGVASWESKFVVAALEEAGWDVRARLTVAPGAVVVQGSDVALDTAVLSAVVVLDSASVPPVAALRRFLANGGGVVLAGSAVAAPGVASLVPARPADRRPGAIGALDGPSPRTGLTGRVFTTVARGAVPLERRGREPIVVASRAGSGRLLLVGYEDTWRWRMVGADDAPEAHRAWWSALVTGVAHAPLMSLFAPFVDEAPLAAAIADLGPPAGGATANARASFPLDAILFAFLLLALLGEWLSRRLRGLR
ncbi:MAG TPA: hypothetical protein VLE53_10115 [Gemmatimonadaceae bacterium]|nr:hypothetical protein [Gemmatimonadaceae bacterium]